MFQLSITTLWDFHKYAHISPNLFLWSQAKGKSSFMRAYSCYWCSPRELPFGFPSSFFHRESQLVSEYGSEVFWRKSQWKSREQMLVRCLFGGCQPFLAFTCPWSQWGELWVCRTLKEGWHWSCTICATCAGSLCISLIPKISFNGATAFAQRMALTSLLVEGSACFFWNL